MSTRVIALVPFKGLTRAKLRLRRALSDAAAEEIGRAMLGDVLDALRDSRAAQTVVLTGDRAVAETAEACGARVALRSPDPGLNAAIDAACADAEREGYAAALTVPGDLPLLEPAHVDAVLEAGESADVVIVPALDGGTALLYRRPPRCLSAAFGPNSAERHRDAAQSAGLSLRELSELADEARGDLDTLEDARRVRQSARATRTRTALEKILG